VNLPVKLNQPHCGIMLITTTATKNIVFFFYSKALKFNLSLQKQKCEAYNIIKKKLIQQLKCVSFNPPVTLKSDNTFYPLGSI